MWHALPVWWLIAIAAAVDVSLPTDEVAHLQPTSVHSRHARHHKEPDVWCPWDTNFSTFRNPHAVLDLYNGQKLCYDAVIYGYDVLFEQNALFSQTTWLGVYHQQDPTDAMMIQEVLHRVKPDVIVELGTNTGGGAFYFASIMSLIKPDGDFVVVTIDPKDITQDWYAGPTRCSGANPCIPAFEHPIWHKHVRYIKGTPTDPAVVNQVAAIIGERQPATVLVSEDSSHTYDVVLQNVRAYAPFVTRGSYLIVQDTKLTRMMKAARCQGVDGAQLDECWHRHKEGPGDAVAAFLNETSEFAPDRDAEVLYYTQHALGYLRRG